MWRYKLQEDLPGEEWKEIEWHGVKLKVSSCGRVEYSSGKKTYGSLCNGYKTVNISKTNIRVHRLICMAFNPINNPEEMVVNHIDENKSNNCIENLEWVTHRENLSAYHYPGRMKNRKYTNKCVIQMKNGEKIAEYDSAMKASEYIYSDCATSNIRTIYGNIIKVCNNEQKTAYGYQWKYSMKVMEIG